jgi:hypothetical protein
LPAIGSTFAATLRANGEHRRVMAVSTSSNTTHVRVRSGRQFKAALRAQPR